MNTLQQIKPCLKKISSLLNKLDFLLIYLIIFTTMYLVGYNMAIAMAVSYVYSAIYYIIKKVIKGSGISFLQIFIIFVLVLLLIPGGIFILFNFLNSL